VIRLRPYNSECSIKLMVVALHAKRAGRTVDFNNSVRLAFHLDLFQGDSLSSSVQLWLV